MCTPVCHLLLCAKWEKKQGACVHLRIQTLSETKKNLCICKVLKDTMCPDGHPQLMSPFCVFISAAKLTTEAPAATAARHEAGASGGGGGGGGSKRRQRQHKL